MRHAQSCVIIIYIKLRYTFYFGGVHDGNIARRYLNQIFNEEELSYIATTTLYQDSSPKYGTPGGSATNDQLFLLSVSEYQNYRNYIPLIPKQGDTFLGTWWWLRAPVTLKIFEINGQSDDWYYGVVIDHEGEIKESVGGCDPDGKEGVRPAMWIELPS